MRTIDQINEQINSLEDELKNIRGTKTEVYTRIVGYHRAVTNWNKGKGEEYKHRKTFSVNEKKLSKEKFAQAKAVKEPASKVKEPQQEVPEVRRTEVSDNTVYYKMFYRQYCRNCSPVKDYLSEVQLNGETLDVGSDLGLNVARKFDIRTTPTVLFFDNKENLIGRAHSIEELREIKL